MTSTTNPANGDPRAVATPRANIMTPNETSRDRPRRSTRMEGVRDQMPDNETPENK